VLVRAVLFEALLCQSELDRQTGNGNYCDPKGSASGSRSRRCL